MNSTDIEVKIRAIFERGVSDNPQKDYLKTAIDKAAISYYEAPQHPEEAYYSFIDTGSVEQLAAYLKDFWSKQGNERFASVAGEISELAFLLSDDSQSQSEDISPFIYTMY